MWAEGLVLVVLALAMSSRPVCQMILGRATLRVLEKLAVKALEDTANHDQVAEALASLIADVPVRGMDHHTYTSVELGSDSAAGSIPRRG
jgi:hypothetical protein